MKIPVKKVGDLCRHCKKPVIEKVSPFDIRKLKKKYFYTHYLFCNKCGTFYMQERFKIKQEDIIKLIKEYGKNR